MNMLTGFFRGNYSFWWKSILLMEDILLMDVIPFSGNHFFSRNPFSLVEATPFSGNRFLWWNAFIFVEAIPFGGTHFL